MADLKYTVDLDFSEAIQDAATAGQQISAKLSSAIDQVTAVKLGVDPGSVREVDAAIKKVNAEIKKGSTSVDAVTRAYSKKLGLINQSIRGHKAEAAALKRSGKDAQYISRELKKKNSIIVRQQREYNKILAILRNINTTTAQGTKSASAMGSVFAGFVGKFTAAGLAIRGIEMAIAKVAEGIGAVVNRAQKISELETALGSFISGQQDIEGVMAHAKATAMAYGVSLDGVEKSWKRVGPAANAAGLSMGQTSKLIEAVSARTAQMGLNAEQTGRYMEAVAQVMGKNKLQSEELTQQFSELDGALRSQLATFFAAKYGIEDMGEAMKKGEIDAKMFGEGMIAISEGAMKSMIQNSASLVQNIEKMSFNQIINQMGTLSAILAEKAGDMFAPLGKGLAESASAFLAWFASFEKRFPQLYDLIDNIMKGIGHSISLAFKGMVMILDIVAGAIEWTITLFNKIPEPIRKLIGFINPLIGAFDDMTDSNSKIVAGLSDADKQANVYLDTIHRTGEIMEEQKQKAQEMIDRKEEEANSAEALQQKMQEEQDRRQAVASGVQGLIEKYQAQTGATNSAALASTQIANAMLNEQMTTEELVGSIEKLAQARQKAAQAQINKEFAAKQSAIDDELRAIEKLKQAEKDRHDTVIRGIQRAKESQSDAHRAAMRALQDEKSALNAKKEASKAYYDKAIANERKRHDTVMKNLDAEIARINKKYDQNIAAAENGPANQELKKLQMEDLEMKSKSAQYTKLERAEFAAQLEDMQNAVYIQQQEAQREAELARIEAQKRAEEAKHEKEMARLQEERDAVQERIAENMEKVVELMLEQKRENEDINEELDDQKTAEDDLFTANNKVLDTKRDILNEQKEINKKLKETATAANTVEGHVRDIARETGNGASAMNRFAWNTQSAAFQMQQLAYWSKQVQSPANGMWTGGPVKGGEKYQVNELGQEGFMTPGGTIKPINVVKNGMWRAPQSGTVIPAHIFKDLNVPATGLKASQPAASANTGADNQRALLKALRGLSGGGNITNHVSIQAANTTQAASDMLVNLTRIKRRRYR